MNCRLEFTHDPSGFYVFASFSSFDAPNTNTVHFILHIALRAGQEKP